MKEELISLKKEINEYLKEKEIFKKKRLFFNMKVEEKEQEGQYKVAPRGDMDAYEEAKIFEEVYQEIAFLVKDIKKTNPRYGQKRIRNMVLEKFIKDSSFGEAQIPIAEVLVDSYFLYESCGYKKVRDQEIKLKELEQNISGFSQAIFAPPKQIIVNINTTAARITKPYKLVVARFRSAKIATKKVVHKSCKNLRKVLKKVEDRTKED